MKWTFNSDLPIYQQIVDIIKQQIASGELAAGQKMPSVRELALEAEVNPNTMQKAMAELEREGLLYSKRTSGRFVAERNEIGEGLKEEMMKECVNDFLDNMKKLGYSLDEIIAILEKIGREEK